MAAITVLVLFKMTVLPSVSEADSLLGDFVRFRNIDTKEQFEDPKPLAVPAAPVIDVDVSALPFDPVLPATLPLGYRLVASELPSDYKLNLFFEHSDGSSFMLLESPAKPGAFVLPPDGGDWATVVDDSPVLVTADPRLDITDAVGWERDGVVFMLMAIEEPSGSLLVSDALALVHAIMTTQDALSQGDPSP